ncbi:hypothetical protein GCM10010289_81100 [Streptomyces violascens]|uniref:Uncharacterized protein n=1 Tax=Streptomyces violascens TaxID=67381 RepID=A0ABQ3QRM0_9ACTN|nr:hypothetical protein GCM10010289_81100 [Streptomyces violascens]GHI39914.1 hypothetical protein Sviol_43220 [Streptomyces violascens]
MVAGSTKFASRGRGGGTVEGSAAPEVSEMSVRSRSGSSIPELTVRVARASNPQGTTAMCIRDQLDGLWSDEDFAEW